MAVALRVLLGLGFLLGFAGVIICAIYGAMVVLSAAFSVVL